MEPKESFEQSNGEFHHFQLVNASGEVPLSISVLVHYNGKTGILPFSLENPINAEDIIALHDALKSFDGNFIKAFSNQK